MIKLELPEAEWLTLIAFSEQPHTRVSVDRQSLARLCRDHTKLVERLKTEIDWAQVLLL